MSVQAFNSWEEAQAAIQAGNEAARAATKPEQWKLCDGEEHWAFTVEMLDSRTLCVIVVHVQSRNQFIANQLSYIPDEDWGKDCESLDEACYSMGVYYGEGGNLSYGYLPCEAWDSYYDRDDPDLHDRHASILVEISKEEFDLFRATRQDPEEVRRNPILRNVALRWLEVTSDGS